MNWSAAITANSLSPRVDAEHPEVVTASMSGQTPSIFTGSVRSGFLSRAKSSQWAPMMPATWVPCG